MKVETLISVDEYLSTSYDPDVEYVDGVLVERNVGDLPHGLVQSNVIFAIRSKYPRVYVIPELRQKTTSTRYRLPDVTIVLSLPAAKYMVDAAFVAIEIVSEDDRMSRMIEKLAEYERKGVANIWVFDPRLRSMSVYSGGALNEVHGETIATVGTPHIELSRDEIFQNVN